MMLRAMSVALFPRVRSEDSPSPGKVCGPSALARCGYRFVKILLAIYLIPALLVVLLVGAVGILTIGCMSLFRRFLDRKSW